MGLRDNLLVLAGVGGIISLAAWQVLSSAQKPGHDLASNEKPQALRNETARTLAGEKAKLAAIDAARAARAQ